MNDLNHKEEHFNSSDLVRDIVIGMSDGLTVPFALAAGLSGAVDNSHVIIIAGIAEVAAGSIAMGLGGYLAGKTEMDHFNSEHSREVWEVENLPEKEKEEVREIFAEMGMSESTQKLIVEEMAKDKEKWVDFMMRYELGLEKPDAKRARNSALNIGISYIIGGMVPLSPYFFFHTPAEGLKWSAVITVLCLLTFGYFKARFTGQNPVAGALRVAIIGSVAAAAAFFIAKLISH
ncbi:MAG: VIT1/CCC1 transporter family protein [Taibaiella sp.]|nr:VIT1/CCC1 transporter family protein [Taibaiella sp.]